MKKLILIAVCILSILLSCKKDKNKEVIKGNIKETTETLNGITFKIFIDKDATTFKGILVMGSGNDENNPSAGALDGATETSLCEKAAANGYASAIVQYQKPPANSTWNDRAKLLGEDFDKCISAISSKYGIDKSKSVIGGYSYASFMLLTNNAYYNSLPYCKGVLAACGAIDNANPSFHIPIFSINCNGNNEGNYGGRALYDKMPAGPIKTRSEGITDNSCTQHCGGDWTNQMYAKMVTWLQ